MVILQGIRMLCEINPDKLSEFNANASKYKIVRKYMNVMKQVLLSMVVMAAGAVMPVAAETVEFDFSTGYENTQYVIEDIIRGGVTLKMSSNGNSKGPVWYSSGAALRLYGGNTVSVAANEKIQSVTFTFSEEKYSFHKGTSAPKVTPGSYSQDGATGVWTVGISSGTLRVGGVNAESRVRKITVVTGEEGTNSVEEIGAAAAAKEVYSLNGVRVQGEKLQSGVYLVRYADGKVEKVLVK